MEWLVHNEDPQYQSIPLFLFMKKYPYHYSILLKHIPKEQWITIIVILLDIIIPIQ